ncbi:hypothetical protein KIH87_03935 [Paraneptunicella aestuarii]|uniref:hypothetical protein n=1 Tax=Paraneptunicella aestuarii TaxID=2831148 RepID=UPI001E4BD58B|nr:hypothetical protein [Paraneptunicella aestuarii]UAA39516.1 hypothetical protein KIH87_03935 [Paraneptunicella aestuarii]
MKSIITKTLLAAATCCMLLPAANADITTSVDRVRWKEGFLNWADHNEYPEWKNEGIWTEYRKNTFVSKYWEPTRSNVRTMVMMIAGQQGFSGSSGASNCLTGQNDTWDSGWDKGDKSKNTSLKSQSLAEKLVNSGYFSSSNTFFSVVLNSNFNWENTVDAKNKAERAFAKWFLKHGDSTKVDRIILLGSSRGGALSVRLARKIRDHAGWGNTPIFVGLIDAVPNSDQNELLTENQPSCTNPYNSSYYSRKADLATYFSGVTKPKIRHIATGAPVIEAVGAVHSFCATESSWYEHSWANLSHTQIGRCNDSEGAAYKYQYMDAGIDKLLDWVIAHM